VAAFPEPIGGRPRSSAAAARSVRPGGRIFAVKPVISLCFAFGAGVVRLLTKTALRCLAREAHPLGERASTNETALFCAASPLLSRVRLSKRRKRSPTPRL
jgi:hypothetical protein